MQLVYRIKNRINVNNYELSACLYEETHFELSSILYFSVMKTSEFISDLLCLLKIIFFSPLLYSTCLIRKIFVCNWKTEMKIIVVDYA